MWVKICGNTRLEDCLQAADVGADAVGFVFAPGKRTVGSEQVAAITTKLPAGLETIGVFTTTDAETIAAAAVAAGLTGIQVHSAYDPVLLTTLRAITPAPNRKRLIQTVHWDVDVDAASQRTRFSEQLQAIASDALADAVLIDSRTTQGSGGTGRPFDWEAVAALLQDSALPVLIAGGLNPGNVAAAVSTLQPWGVDVSSGVEDRPGIKIADAVREFIDNARTAQ